MKHNQPHCLRPLGLFLLLAWIAAPPVFSTEKHFPETISVLQTVYQNEMTAMHTYMAYAQRAEEEKYLNISRLLTAIARSESIHARNFRSVLKELGAPADFTMPENIVVQTTRENLQWAMQNELAEIDKTYPFVLEKIKPENHRKAIDSITWAWKSEKQHRDLIKLIESGTGIFFDIMAHEIESARDRQFVCQNCGSTLTELPEHTCPICGQPASRYQEIFTQDN